MTKRTLPDWDQLALLRRFLELPPKQRTPEFLTPAEAGLRLGLSDARVRQLADAGIFGHIKPTGGRIYIHWPTVLKTLEAEASHR